jgi:hypothetical protein
MKMLTRLLLALAIATPLITGDAAAIRPRRKIVLFNKRNLDGWYTWLRDRKYEDPNRVFSVQKGVLRVSGEEWGGLATKDAYRDYHLVVEWKWGGPNHGKREKAARDSGVLIHGRGEDGAAYGTWLESIECQAIEGGTGDFILVGGRTRPSLTVETRIGPDKQLYWQKGGKPETRDRARFNWFGRDVDWKDTLGFRARRDVEKPAGQWNRYEIICHGDTITNKLNGVVVNMGMKAVPSEGKIQIQSEGAEILIRKVELRPVRTR